MNKKGFLSSPTPIFLASVFFVTFNSPQWFSDAFRFILYLVAPILALAFLLYQQVTNRKHVTLTPVSVSLILFYALTFILMCVHGEVMHYGLGHICFFMTAYAALWERPNSDIKEEADAMAKLLTVLTLAFCVASLIFNELCLRNPGIMDALVGTNFEVLNLTVRPHGERFYTLTGGPNTLSNLGCYSMGFSIYLLMTSKSKGWKAISITSAAFNVLIIMLCWSRTSMMTAAIFSATFIFFLLISGEWKKDKALRFWMALLVVAAIVAFALIAIAIAMSPEIRETISTKIVRPEEIKTATGRHTLWRNALSLAKEHPIIGVGQETITEQGTNWAHNLWLQIVASSGVPALILFMVYFVLCIAKGASLAIKNNLSHEERIVLALLFAMVPALLFQNIFELFLFTHLYSQGFLCYWALSSLAVIHRNEKDTA